MLNKWFYGALGKLAGIAYTLGTASLIASLLVVGTTTVGLASLEEPSDLETTESTCPDSPPWYKVASDDLSQYPVEGAIAYCFKAGSSNSQGCEGGLFNDLLDFGNGGLCGLSHWAYKLRAPTNTIVPSVTSTDEPTATPTQKGDSTTTPTSTATNEPANTPSNTPSTTAIVSSTNSPTNTPTDTPASSASSTPTGTNTPDPRVTATETNTPTNTPTNTATVELTSTPSNTPLPPNLVDPKVDWLIQDNDGNNLPSPGDVLQYVMAIYNNGGSSAEDVFFNDSPDVNTELVVGSVTTTKGSVVVGNTAGDIRVSVDIGTIEVDETVTITFNVTIIIGISTNVTSVSNQGIITGSNIPEQPSDDPDTGDQDDSTDTPIVHPTPRPNNTPSEPGDPTSVATTIAVLIPVTGVERSAQSVGGLNSELFVNLGLGLLGIGLVLQGLSRRQRQRNS